MLQICNQQEELTLNEVLDEWLAETRLRVKKSTASSYTRIAKSHIRPTLGELIVSDLTHKDLEMFLGNIKSSLSSSSAKLCCVTLRSALKYALEQGYINKLPSFTAPRGVKTEMRSLNYNEQQRLQEVIVAQLNSEKQAEVLRALAQLLCLHTGMRLGEICALKWADISYDCKMITIKRTVQRIPVYDESLAVRTVLEFDTPKSQSSNRKIPVPNGLVSTLIKLRADDDCFVLSGDPEKICEPRAIQRAFKTSLKKAEVADINFHALRHTFATNCVEAGCDLSSLARVLGHSDVSVTLNTYVHPSIDGIRRLMDNLAPVL